MPEAGGNGPDITNFKIGTNGNGGVKGREIFKRPASRNSVNPVERPGSSR